MAKVVTLPAHARSPVTARIRRARCAAGLTQEQAGELVGRNARYVRRLENGEVPLTQLELLDALEMVAAQRAGRKAA